MIEQFEYMFSLSKLLMIEDELMGDAAVEVRGKTRSTPNSYNSRDCTDATFNRFSPEFLRSTSTPSSIQNGPNPSMGLLYYIRFVFTALL
jgi:hypothetical protein